MSERHAPTLHCRHPSSKLWAIGLFLLLVIASSRFAMGAIWRRDVSEAGAYVLYQAGTLAFSYFEFGAIRRGLGGSIAQLLSTDPQRATIAFHFVSAAAVAGVAVLLLRRAQASTTPASVFALVMLVIMLRWGDDGGRTDMAVAALLGGATLAFKRSRPAAAAACIAIGLFIHETAFIFGWPLLAALVLQAGGWRALSRRDRLAGTAWLLGALVVYVGMRFLPQTDVRTMVETVRGRLPPHEHVEWALYYALSGTRGVVTSICQNLSDPSYWVHPASGMVVVGLVGSALLPDHAASWRRALVAALPGFVFLSVFANDMSRWAMFASFNVWLLCVAAPVAQSTKPPGRRLALGIAAAIVLVPLVLYRPSIVAYRIYAPSPFIEAVVRKLGGPRTPSVEEALQRCDPGWREVLDPR